MAKKEPGQDQTAEPRYTIGEIMDLLGRDEPYVRELIAEAGVDLDPDKHDPSERIDYADYRKLWISRANRAEGKKLTKLLIEESSSWFDGLFRT
jgi:hypothetical protein